MPFPGRASFIHSVIFLPLLLLSQELKVECKRTLGFKVVSIVNSQPPSRQKMERKNGFLQTTVSDQGAFYLLTCLTCTQDMVYEKVDQT